MVAGQHLLLKHMDMFSFCPHAFMHACRASVIPRSCSEILLELAKISWGKAEPHVLDQPTLQLLLERKPQRQVRRPTVCVQTAEAAPPEPLTRSQRAGT